MKTIPLCIGVSGPQHLGDEATSSFVARHFRDGLNRYRQQEPDMVLYAALEPGADQLFVRTALALEIPVEIVLPCQSYEQIFPTEEAKQEYRRLLACARQIHHLPPRDCSNEIFLAAGQWIVDQSDVMILAWNGQPPQGRGGTGEVAAYARSTGCPFVHLHTGQLTVTTYGDLSPAKKKATPMAPKQEFTLSKRPVYEGPVLTVQRHELRLPDGQEIIRDVVERPESVLVLPVGLNDIILLIEEYDFGAGAWQLTLPGGKVDGRGRDALVDQAQQELRQESGYRAGRLEKLLDLYSHPGYISHKVHVFVARDLVWDPLAPDLSEEIRVQTYTVKEALAETLVDYRCDPEAALALWAYARTYGYV